MLMLGEKKLLFVEVLFTMLIPETELGSATGSNNFCELVYTVLIIK
jgi:hypothetical protein